MIDCMWKYYLKQMVFPVLYIKEHICVIKKGHPRQTLINDNIQDPNVATPCYVAVTAIINLPISSTNQTATHIVLAMYQSNFS